MGGLSEHLARFDTYREHQLSVNTRPKLLTEYTGRRSRVTDPESVDSWGKINEDLKQGIIFEK